MGRLANIDTKQVECPTCGQKAWIPPSAVAWCSKDRKGIKHDSMKMKECPKATQEVKDA